MLYCPGSQCPLRGDCYRHTQPSPGRDAFTSLPYDPVTRTCARFKSNIPTEASVRQTAYYLWLRQGRPENGAQEHWNAAYRTLCASSGRGV